MRKDTDGAGAVCRVHMFENNQYLELCSAGHRNNLFSAQDLCKQEFYLMPEMKNLSQCAVGIVHHFQSEAELDVIITIQVFTRIFLPSSAATR